MYMRFFITFFTVSLILFICGTGCTSTRVIEDTRVPEIRIDAYGTILIHNKTVSRDKLAAAIKSAGFLHTQEINILIPDNADRTLMRFISGELVRCGYSRMIFVTTRKSSSIIPNK